jgi:demethylmacrocin O-methyltransferase
MRFVESVIAAADGTYEETVSRLASLDAERAGEAVLAEVASRARLAPGPPMAVVVEYELGLGDRTLRILLTTGPDGVRVHAEGKQAMPSVCIRQDLAELARAVYGPPGVPGDATRAVILAGDAESLDAIDETWHAKRQAAAVAAGQLVSAATSPVPDLGPLALRFGSDKWGEHWYMTRYQRHLADYRDQRVRVLEIGIGGYGAAGSGGGSLQMWQHYFRRGLIYGLDLAAKSHANDVRIQTIRGDQADAEFLAGLAAEIGPLDIVIDDGSHLSDHVLGSFATLFPLLRPGGLYVIEDLQTSYWTGWNGRRTDPNDPGTTMGFLKTLADGLHHQELLQGKAIEPSPFDRTVTAVHLYRNLAFIEKGANAEPPPPAWFSPDLDAAVWFEQS